jgi:hypothetical protein
VVWNIKNKTQRFVTLTPTTSWGGKGLIGVTIRMDDYAIAEENLLRVLSVEQHSPAFIAGLTPQTDYMLGTTMDSFENEDVLANVLEECEENVVEMYVYNTVSDVVRVVTLIPTMKWKGGRGLLGAEIGRGYLHRLPKGCRDTLGVSFERKVLVNDNDGATVCGAVDLKLNEAVADSKVTTAVPAAATTAATTGDSDNSKVITENQNLVEQELTEGIAKTNLEDVNDNVNENEKGVEDVVATTDATAPTATVVDECTNATNDIIENTTESAGTTETTTPIMEVSNDNGDNGNGNDDDELPPVPTISKFPTTPQLDLHNNPNPYSNMNMGMNNMDLNMNMNLNMNMGMTHADANTQPQSEETLIDLDLPPPPISPTVDDVLKSDDLTSVDLR